MLNKAYVYLLPEHTRPQVCSRLSISSQTALFCDVASKSNINEFAEFDAGSCFGHPLP